MYISYKFETINYFTYKIIAFDVDWQLVGDPVSL